MFPLNLYLICFSLQEDQFFMFWIIQYLELSIQDNMQNAPDIYNDTAYILFAMGLHTSYTLHESCYLSSGSEDKQLHSALMPLSRVFFPICIREDGMRDREEVQKLALEKRSTVLRIIGKIHFRFWQKHLWVPK